MNVTRIPHPEVKEISTANSWYGLGPGQMFYSTPKAWEIWQETPTLRFIKRIPRKRVFWVIEK